jgi:hypothetical protein
MSYPDLRGKKQQIHIRNTIYAVVSRDLTYPYLFLFFIFLFIYFFFFRKLRKRAMKWRQAVVTMTMTYVQKKTRSSLMDILVMSNNPGLRQMMQFFDFKNG